MRTVTHFVDDSPIAWAARIVDQAQEHVGTGISPSPPRLSDRERIQAIAIIAAVDIQRRLLAETLIGLLR